MKTIYTLRRPYNVAVTQLYCPIYRKQKERAVHINRTWSSVSTFKPKHGMWNLF
jgi:hypothetical protein